MPSYAKSVLIDAPVETVFAFHEREDALQLLTPAFPPVRLITKSGRGLQPGTKVELSVLGFRWIAQHTIYQKNRLFVDQQTEGPFARWIHRHEFEDVGVSTRLTDRVEYLLPGGPIVNLLFGWTVTIGLHQMFRYRHKVTEQHCVGPVSTF